LYSEVSNDALDSALSRDILWCAIAQSILFWVWWNKSRTTCTL